MKLSARNCLKGKVKKVIAGAVNSEVILELPGGISITSIVTKEAVESLREEIIETVEEGPRSSQEMIEEAKRRWSPS